MSQSEETTAHNYKDEQPLEKEIEREIHKLKYFLDEMDNMIQLLKGWFIIYGDDRAGLKVTGS